MQDPSPFFLKWLPEIKPGGHMLDLACGSGRHTRAALEAGLRVTAVDIDTSSLGELEANEGLEIVAADLESAPWPLGERTFDGVIVTNYLWRPLFPHIAKAVACGGLLLYETFAVGNEKYGKPSNREFLLRGGELRKVFQEDFEVLLFEQTKDMVPKPSLRQRLVGRRLS